MLRIFHQYAFKKQERTVILKPMYKDYIIFIERITRMFPLKVFTQFTTKNDLSQFLEFFLPPIGIVEEFVNLGI